MKGSRIGYEDEHGNSIMPPWMIPPDEAAAAAASTGSSGTSVREINPSSGNGSSGRSIMVPTGMHSQQQVGGGSLGGDTLSLSSAPVSNTSLEAMRRHQQMVLMQQHQQDQQQQYRPYGFLQRQGVAAIDDGAPPASTGSSTATMHMQVQTALGIDLSILSCHFCFKSTISMY